MNTTTEINEISEKLDELLNAARATSIPLRERYLCADGVGALLGYSARHVAERLACRRDFPRPLRIANGRPRWNAGEIMDWAKAHKAN